MIRISNFKKYRFTILKFFIFSLIMIFIFKNNHLLKDSLNKDFFLEDYYTFIISILTFYLLQFTVLAYYKIFL